MTTKTPLSIFLLLGLFAGGACDTGDGDVELDADTDALEEATDGDVAETGELDEAPVDLDADDELRPPQEVVFGRTIVEGPGGLELVTYRDVGGTAIADGDVSLGPVDELPAFDEQDLERITSGELPLDDPDVQFAFAAAPIWGQAWPNGVVYYVDPQLDEDAFDQQIRTSIALMEIFTDLDFVAIPESWSPFFDHVYFRASFYQATGTASSPVGRQGGRQYVNFSWFDVATGQLPSTGLVQHELAHAVGMFHEHQRPDRDNFVTVVWPCIQANALSNFEKRAGIPSGPYDPSSIMHYSTTTFALGQGFCQFSLLSTTGATLGGGSLTPGDIAGLNFLASL